MPNTGNLYLAIYNTLQLAGWSLALWKTIHASLLKDKGEVYTEASPVIRLCQGAAFLEVVHALLGVVRASWVTAFLQWFGRSNVLFAILSCVSKVQKGWPVPALFLAWTLSELVRYPWYAVAQFREPPYILTWLRYSMFIVLYPIGVASEVAIIFRSLPTLRDSKLHCVELPNWLNFAFSYYYFNLFGLFVLYPLAFPWLFNTLLQQRRKRFGTSKTTEKTI